MNAAEIFHADFQELEECTTLTSVVMNKIKIEIKFCLLCFHFMPVNAGNFYYTVLSSQSFTFCGPYSKNFICSCYFPLPDRSRKRIWVKRRRCNRRKFSALFPLATVAIRPNFYPAKKLLCALKIWKPSLNGFDLALLHPPKTLTQ